MFYLLSKILGLLVNPLFWIVTLLVLGLCLKKQKLKRRLLLWAVVLLVFFSNGFILNEILRPWERYREKEPHLQHYEYGVVLSGMTYYDTEHNRVNFLRSSDRIWQAVKLYSDGTISKILITGGPASFFYKDTVESVVLRDYLVNIGIPSSDILVEEEARNTHENALFTSQLLNGQSDSLLLITSALHMRRAFGCFKKAGLNCDTFPTDYYSGTRQWNIDNLFFPSPNVLFKWNAFIHELVGVLIYRLMGYI